MAVVENISTGTHAEEQREKLEIAISARHTRKSYYFGKQTIRPL
jgi:hypothetical protein